MHSEPDRLKSFTATKFDWLEVVAADTRLGPREFEVAFAIAQRINMKSGVCVLSDEAIKDATNIPIRRIGQARNALRARGWLDWRRTGSANVYWMLSGENSFAGVQYQQKMRKLARDERREARRLGRRVRTPLSEPDRTPSSERNIDEPTPSTEHVRTPSADKHLLGTLEVTKDDAAERDIGEGRRTEPGRAPAVQAPAQCEHLLKRRLQ